MGAPKGNQFWKLRSKHGRDKLFATPELLWEAACEYFEWCEENPLLEEQLIKTKVDRDSESVDSYKCNKMRPFTLHGLCLYLDCNTMYFSQFANSLDGKTDQLSKDFSFVVTRIRETIYNQKFSGAAAGFLNANIIARDLGLKDTTELNHSGQITVLPPQLKDAD